MARKHQRRSGYTGNKGGSNTDRVYPCRCGFKTMSWTEWIQHRQTCPELNK